MRLFLSPKEAKDVKEAIQDYASYLCDYEKEVRLYTVVERIKLCEELQDNERRSKNDAE